MCRSLICPDFSLFVKYIRLSRQPNLATFYSNACNTFHKHTQRLTLPSLYIDDVNVFSSSKSIQCTNKWINNASNSSPFVIKMTNFSLKNRMKFGYLDFRKHVYPKCWYLNCVAIKNHLQDFDWLFRFYNLSTARSQGATQ